jgi:hypothetical protein
MTLASPVVLALPLGLLVSFSPFVDMHHSLWTEPYSVAICLCFVLKYRQLVLPEPQSFVPAHGTEVSPDSTYTRLHPYILYT